ncbi:hypothetical protein A2634_04570 [Candidatus Amesbacteria bacterium RIFCSPHIGHO2_01_FULL_48_32]|uniref:Peptidase E n=1 Tax=Candidatus Amesbacteria bacterium RIFCSPLOWO2_01_FULL_48_25 TaxID=1797259 RepID=A0A1F4ZBZ8_9BACT|nr:MAG: hypothetical protein A2634_04570 [Candidatus Amesbacteria bacterium RIFCSPHIGHO2_01_FULL_48_32]OGD03813.1 MAG: hypothetical protein A2989_04040 [Candidatus Amesbacteria bacterium RIFCSPLOWO2_01_FULL_48_25]HJZ05077.1 Type 1 glutamine amidotransferase-like domain-containing protein [Patescibacteria group bacterium]
MGILALIGSGEFTPAGNEVDKFLISQTKNPKIAILPTAAGLEPDFQKWINDGIAHFKKLGATATGIHLLNRKDAMNNELSNHLTNFNFFYFSGGDPGHLLDTLKGSPAWKVILNKFKSGATLAAASAGAMVIGNSVWARVYAFDKKGEVLPWEPGLNLVNFGLIPHFNEIPHYFNPEQIELVKKNLPKIGKIIGIDENTAYVKIKKSWRILGAGSIHNARTTL